MILVVLSLLILELVAGAPYSLGPCKTTFNPPSLQDTHREIRARFVNVWRSNVGNGIVYLRGNIVSNREGTDTEVEFRQESNFLYITGVTYPDFSVVIDITATSSNTILFVPFRDDYWAIWNGVVETIEELRVKYGIQDVYYTNQLDQELRKIVGTRTIYTLPGVSIPGFTVNQQRLRDVLGISRVVKTSYEVQLLEIAANVSSDAHIAVMKDSASELYEYNFASYFEYYTSNCGLLHQSYLPITAYGKHSAILHYNVPIGKVDGSGLMLIDAGAEYTYGTDITRTFPVNGKYSNDQALVYNSVLRVVLEVERQIKPGTKWSAMNTLARQLVTEELLKGGFLRGTLSQLLSNSMYKYFYPHSLGHSVGIDVHDPGRIEDLQANMVITVEPGIYFNSVLIEQGIREQSQYMNAAKCREFLANNFGGVRIEDTIRVTSTGIEILSWVPKTIEEIEKIMTPDSQYWPSKQNSTINE